MTTLTKLVVGMSKVGDHLLKRKASGIIVAALAFACGAGLAYGLKVRRPPKQAAPAAATAVCSNSGTYSAPPPVAEYTPADEYEYGDSPELQQWKNRHSGATLPLDYGEDWDDFGEPKVVVLRSGRMLAAAGDSLYMLGADNRVVWKQTVTQWVIDFAHVEATGLVYLTAGDNSLLILDAATGRVLHAESRNGSAGYGEVIPYGDDACIVMDAYGGYRAHLGGVEPTQDGATAWRGTRMLWHLDVPPDARLQVAGSRVYAVTKTKTRLLVRELNVPKR
ncbi:MAG TPA: PQQ-binding-like beta-propeller repeat protein [Pyrinomonadaceae bacterium]|jgi:outer membrane protein assembly factor BamB